jgi:hypothetical protein
MNIITHYDRGHFLEKNTPIALQFLTIKKKSDSTAKNIFEGKAKRPFTVEIPADNFFCRASVLFWKNIVYTTVLRVIYRCCFIPGMQIFRT